MKFVDVMLLFYTSSRGLNNRVTPSRLLLVSFTACSLYGFPVECHPWILRLELKDQV